jgi:hypothetical protein
VNIVGGSATEEKCHDDDHPSDGRFGQLGTVSLEPRERGEKDTYGKSRNVMICGFAQFADVQLFSVFRLAVRGRQHRVTPCGSQSVRRSVSAP